MGQDQVSGGVTVLCWLTVAIFYGSLQKELARIHGKSAHLANCSQLFKKSFLDKNVVPLATTINY